MLFHFAVLGPLLCSNFLWPMFCQASLGSMGILLVDRLEWAASLSPGDLPTQSLNTVPQVRFFTILSFRELFLLSFSTCEFTLTFCRIIRHSWDEGRDVMMMMTMKGMSDSKHFLEGSHLTCANYVSAQVKPRQTLCRVFPEQVGDLVGGGWMGWNCRFVAMLCTLQRPLKRNFCSNFHNVPPQPLYEPSNSQQLEYCFKYCN